MSAPVNRRRFGTFELDLATGELRRDGIKLKLQQQPFQLLALLLEQPGEMVTREAVRDRLWPGDTFVDFDHGLNTAVRKLRHALDDSAENPRFIETVARRGYRFIAPVVPTGADPTADASAPPVDVGEPPVATGQAAPARRADRRLIVGGIAALIAVLATAGAWRFLRASSSPAAVAPSAAPLAVLPFKVLTSGESEKFLGIGIADAVITQLANIRGLHVRPTAAVLKYNADTTDPTHAGRELGAAHVVAGTLHRGDSSYRISVQLLRTSDGAAIWGRNYDVAHADLLTVEDRVSEQVADALRVRLTADDRPAHRPPANPTAYEPYLLGRGLLVNYSEARMRGAIASFERALQLDPDYALARAGLAMALAWFSVRYAYENEALMWGRRAEEEAKRALALDPGLADAHLAIANAAGTKYGHFNWLQVIAEADEALQIEPALDLALAARARALYHLGLFDSANAAASQALAINPDSTIETRRLEVAFALFNARFDDARSRAEELVKVSDAPVVRLYLGQALFYVGERTRAADLLASIRRGDQPDVRSQAALAGVLAATGRTADAQAIIDRIIHGPYMDHHVAYSLGSAFAQLRRTKEALTWLRAAIDDGFPCQPWYAQDPMLEPIRADAGFRTLMADLQQQFEAARARYVLAR